MIKEQLNNWKAYIIRGILSLLLGMIFISIVINEPLLAVNIVATLFVFYLLGLGLISLVMMFRKAEPKSSLLLLIQGIFTILLAIAAAVWPQLTVLLLVVMIAIWALISGLMDILFSIISDYRHHSRWYLIISGSLSVVLGVILLLWPAIGLYALMLSLSAFTIISGALILSYGLSMRRSNIAQQDTSIAEQDKVSSQETK